MCGNQPDVESVGYLFLFGLVPASNVVAAALVGHQLLVWLHDDRVEVLDSIILLNVKMVIGSMLGSHANAYHFGAHRVARSQRQSIGEVANVLVLVHARRILGQSFGIDHAVEGQVLVRHEMNFNIVRVASDVNVSYGTKQICQGTEGTKTNKFVNLLNLRKLCPNRIASGRGGGGHCHCDS